MRNKNECKTDEHENITLIDLFFRGIMSIRDITLKNDGGTLGFINLIMTLLASFMTILDYIFKFGILDNVIQLIQNSPELFLFKIGEIFALVVLVSLVVSLIWQPNFLNTFSNLPRKNKFRFFIQLTLTSFILFLLLTAISLWPFSYSKFNTHEAEILFPQAAELGPVLIQTYASNGEAHYSFHTETPINGPDGYVKVTLKANNRYVENNAGWVMFLLKGSDISSYKQLRFRIKGEQGGEIIGIKAKDAKGRESYLMLDEHYLANGVTNDWQQVSIPFEDFGDVDFSLIDNFSFFTTGDLAETRPQIIYLGEFQLR